MRKTASGLVAYCKAQLGRPYWWGTFGNTATAQLYYDKKAQYPAYYTAGDFMGQVGQRVHDCVGMIKGYLWSATPESVPVYTASQDVNVPMLYARCSRRGGITAMPDRPGVCVFMGDMSHVGVYIGGGEVIEARGHAYGVVRTKLAGRGWRYWGMPDWIEYDTAEGTDSPAKEETVMVEARILSRGSGGSAVRKLQILLEGLGYVCGGADGDFGGKTDDAVKAFQGDNGLAKDGVVGAQTWGKLIG